MKEENKDKLVLVTDDGHRYFIIQEYSNGFHYFRAVSVSSMKLSEAVGKTIAELEKELEAIEEVVIVKVDTAYVH